MMMGYKFLSLPLLVIASVMFSCGDDKTPPANDSQKTGVKVQDSNIKAPSFTYLLKEDFSCGWVINQAEKTWGPTVDGLRCRVYVKEHDPLKSKPIYELTVEIENVGLHSVELPLLDVVRDGEIPKLRIEIREEPDVHSPAMLGFATPGFHELLPGGIFSYRIGGHYGIAYGRYSKQSGWIRFSPEDKLYHLTVKVDTGRNWIKSNEVPIRLPDYK